MTRQASASFTFSLLAAICLLFLGFAWVSDLQSAPNDTEDYYLCAHKVDGQWGAFGKIPKACDIDPFAAPNFVFDQLAVAIFDDNQLQSDETLRYMDNLNASLKAAASYYYSTRNPTASTQEINQWLQAIKSLATVESYWSHYRLATDQRLKMIRGDLGHGHGMMQIDDRWHFVAIESGVGWHLFENWLYAFEIFYAEWQRAPSQSCVSSATSWVERSRSAYSAYNGGPSKICRWQTNPITQDNNFIELYTGQPWQAVINQTDLASPLDVVCFLEAEPACLPPVDNSPQADWQYQLLQLTNGHYCLFYGSEFHCIEDSQDVVCLNKVLDYVSRNSLLSLDAAQSSAFAEVFYETHQCLSHVSNSFKVSQAIRTIQSINIRQTPGGALTGSATRAGGYYQILDLVVTNQDQQYRYYRIEEGNVSGYIYAGSADTYQDWAVLADTSQLSVKSIATADDKILVTATNGLNLRETTDMNSNLLVNIPKESQLRVLDTQIIGMDNNVYYQISYDNQLGWVYAGHILPTSSLADWVSIQQPTAPPPPAPQSSGGGGSSELFFLVFIGFLHFRKQKLRVLRLNQVLSR